MCSPGDDVVEDEDGGGGGGGGVVDEDDGGGGDWYYLDTNKRGHMYTTLGDHDGLNNCSNSG